MVWQNSSGGVQRDARLVLGARESQTLNLLVHLFVVVEADHLDDEQLLAVVAQDEFLVQL